jgi:hypothetical protein
MPAVGKWGLHARKTEGSWGKAFIMFMKEGNIHIASEGERRRYGASIFGVGGEGGPFLLLATSLLLFTYHLILPFLSFPFFSYFPRLFGWVSSLGVSKRSVGGSSSRGMELA